MYPGSVERLIRQTCLILSVRPSNSVHTASASKAPSGAGMGACLRMVSADSTPWGRARVLASVALDHTSR